MAVKISPEETNPTRRLERKVLSGQVRDLILDRILKGEYAPGSRLVETRIAKEFGVSQGTVREALRALEGLRVIETTPFAGARVRSSVPEEELLEVHPVRAALEGLAAELGAERLRKNVIPLWQEIEGMRGAARRRDPEAYVAHNAAFHRAIVEAAGNRVLLASWEALGVDSRILITTMTTRTDLAEAAELHVPIAEAFAEGKARAAKALLARHQSTYQRKQHSSPLLGKKASAKR